MATIETARRAAASTTTIASARQEAATSAQPRRRRARCGSRLTAASRSSARRPRVVPSAAASGGHRYRAPARAASVTAGGSALPSAWVPRAPARARTRSSACAACRPASSRGVLRPRSAAACCAKARRATAASATAVAVVAMASCPGSPAPVPSGVRARWSPEAASCAMDPSTGTAPLGAMACRPACRRSRRLRTRSRTTSGRGRHHVRSPSAHPCGRHPADLTTRRTCAPRGEPSIARPPTATALTCSVDIFGACAAGCDGGSRAGARLPRYFHRHRKARG